MPESKVWRITPRKLAALADVHIRVNSGEDQPQDKDSGDAIKAFMMW